MDCDRRTLERTKRFALEGNYVQAKFAARFLAFSKNKVMVCKEVVEVCHFLHPFFLSLERGFLV
jgi:hypothetical protein